MEEHSVVSKIDRDGELRLAYSPGEVAALLGCSRPFIYTLMADEKLPSLKLGGRRLIPAAAITEKLAEAR
jgi:excisionase family DNA binding protein